MAETLTIWSNAELPDYAAQQLAMGIGKHHLLLEQPAPNIAAGGPSAALEEADIAFGQPDANQICELPNLKWVHITSAGYTRYDTDSVREALQSRGAILTNSSTVFSEPCAQHLLAFMLSQARQIPQSLLNQVNGAWAYAGLRPRTQLLLPTQSVVIVGYGAIATRLSELLAPFEMNLVGVRRTVRGDETIPMIELDSLDDALASADHVINILPANASTEGFFDAKRLSQMKLGANFYNIGRGTTVDQDALIRALEAGRIACAYLDVVDPEPLPNDNPLWRAPNCWITPHIAGGHAEEYSNLVDHFLNNLQRFEDEDDLVDRII